MKPRKLKNAKFLKAENKHDIPKVFHIQDQLQLYEIKEYVKIRKR